MKTYRLGESSIHTRFRRRAAESSRISPRETITLGDPTDCLLDAYDFVAQRAYDNFLAHGAHPGGELQDWLDAERQLLLNFPVDIQESNDFIYALASVPGATAARISIGIESRWMVILVRQPREHPQMVPASPGAAGDSDTVRSEHLGAESKSSPESQWDAQRSPDPSQDDRRTTSVCVMGLPHDVDGTRSIAVLADGVLGIRMAKLHPRA
jgi:HSP20 family molecular chaperone IbpA